MAAEARKQGDESVADDLRREGDICLNRAEEIEIHRVQKGWG